MPTMPQAPEPFVALGRDAATLGLRLDRAQLEACERYARELAEATKTVNLTAITEVPDIAVRHFLDSFTAYAARRWSGHERVIDIGSGAGFPGMALRIALPGVRLTCVEATGKKARFIERMLDDLALDAFREAVWRLTGLMRVFLGRGGAADGDPLALEPGSTVEDVAHAIHHELAESFHGARIWGASARFPGQRVGRAHVVADGDIVEIMH